MHLFRWFFFWLIHYRVLYHRLGFGGKMVLGTPSNRGSKFEKKCQKRRRKWSVPFWRSHLSIFRIYVPKNLLMPIFVSRRHLLPPQIGAQRLPQRTKVVEGGKIQNFFIEELFFDYVCTFWDWRSFGNVKIESTCLLFCCVSKFTLRSFSNLSRTRRIGQLWPPIFYPSRALRVTRFSKSIVWRW